MARRRWFVGLFLGVLAVAAVADVNAWPMTGWRLFSTTRGPTQAGWEAVVVSSTGAEAPVPFERLPRGYRGGRHVLQEFPRLSPSARGAVCRAWVDGARAAGVDAAGVRVYRTRSTVSLGGSPPTTTVRREEGYSC
ncbi:MAG TPA: hypothetical protein VM938_10725 [Acidimicrobiales bacterium]|nr:hypothetical protein [Acidimicrobiales bacterium]